MGIIDNARNKMLGEVRPLPQQGGVGLAEQYSKPKSLTLDEQLKAGIITPEVYREALLYSESNRPLGGLQ